MKDEVLKHPDDLYSHRLKVVWSLDGKRNEGGVNMSK